MDYCSFFGLSAPQLVLLDLDAGLFKDLVKMLNNAQDTKRLRNLMTEFDLLSSFLENEVIEEYDNPDIRKKARQIKLSKEHYATGKTVPKNMLLSEEEIPQIENLISSAKKRIAPYMMRDGKRVDISEPAVKIISFLRRNIGLVAPYVDNIKLNATKEITVFNRRLEDLVYGKPESLKYRYMNKISQAKSSSSKKANAFLPIIVESIRKDIDILLNSMQEGTVENEEYTPNGIVIQNSKSGEALIASYPPYYPQQAKPLILKLHETGLLGGLSRSEVSTLANLYCAVMTMSADLYNLQFGLNLTIDEYEKVFDELDELGLVGLNIYAEQFLFNCLNGVVFMKDMDATITNPEMAIVVLEIDRAISGLILSYGEEI